MSYFISNYERQYMSALSKIYNEGYSDGVNERTGKETKRIPGAIFQVDVEKEFPVLKSKFVASKTSLREILWIWQAKSNNIHDLKAHIWNSWADSNGSIGRAYGAQIKKPVCIFTDPIHKTLESFRAYPDQTHYILGYLTEFPNGRWGVATLWNVNDLHDMNLVPCCHTTTWNLDGGRLNCLLDQRSGDMPYGVPFNTTQYAELMVLFARHLGVKPGILTHVIADAHIYDNQMDGVQKQIAYWQLIGNMYDGLDCTHNLEECAKLESEESDKEVTTDEIKDRAISALESVPKFVVNSEETNFFNVNVDDISIEDYTTMGKISFGDVAV